jgi:hypothetical protein
MKLSKKSKNAIKKFIQYRKEHTGWKNHDPEMITDALIELGISAYRSDCWGHASTAITDDGEISMRG